MSSSPDLPGTDRHETHSLPHLLRTLSLHCFHILSIPIPILAILTWLFPAYPVRSFVSQFSSGTKSPPTPAASPTATSPIASPSANDHFPDHRIGLNPPPTPPSYPEHGTVEGSATPDSPPHKRQRSNSRPLSINAYQPPLMDITEDTIPELQPVFSFLNSHSNKLYQEGYFLKLDDQNTRMSYFPNHYFPFVLAGRDMPPLFIYPCPLKKHPHYTRASHSASRNSRQMQHSPLTFIVKRASPMPTERGQSVSPSSLGLSCPCGMPPSSMPPARMARFYQSSSTSLMHPSKWYVLCAVAIKCLQASFK